MEGYKLGGMKETTPASAAESRVPAAIAVVAVGGLYLAFPQRLIVGPRWLFPLVVAALLVPTMIAHRLGYHRLDRALGYAVGSVVTLGLVLSLALLITALPSHQEQPLELMRSAVSLWVTNVLVFALWYWRIDAGGPHRRDARAGHTEGSFFFPQMIQGAPRVDSRRWSPHFIDYLFIAFNTSTAFSPTDTPVLSPWAKILSMLQALISLAVVAILAARAVGML
jgi:hypothetical protein